METVKQIMDWFLDNVYLLTWNESSIELKQKEKQRSSYKSEINNICLQTDRDDIVYEAWLLTWYKVILQSLLNEIEESNNQIITADRIKYLLNN